MNFINITKKRSKTVRYVTILCTPMYTALTYIIKQKGTSFMTSKELTKLAVAALEDRKAEDVTVIDISEISPITLSLQTEQSRISSRQCVTLPMKPYTKPA